MAEIDEELAPINLISNDDLFCVFSFLSTKDLIAVEQVCCKWKELVIKFWASKTTLKIDCELPDDAAARRVLSYIGKNLREISFEGYLLRNIDTSFLYNFIADECPNLETIIVYNVCIVDAQLEKIASNCKKIRKVHLHDIATCTEEGLNTFFKSLPELSTLTILCEYRGLCLEGVNQLRNVCFQSGRLIQIDREGSDVFFSKYNNLEKLELLGEFVVNEYAFRRFCKENTSLRSLLITGRSVPARILSSISELWRLEKLELSDCYKLDDLTLTLITKECRKLKSIVMFQLPDRVTDIGVKSLVKCAQLEEITITLANSMTDISLSKLSNLASLKKVTLTDCYFITHRGCNKILSRCPNLQLLEVQNCSNITSVNILRAALSAVKTRTNGLELNLGLEGTGIKLGDMTLQNFGHPLLTIQLTVEEPESNETTDQTNENQEQNEGNEGAEVEQNENVGSDNIQNGEE